MTTSDNSDGRSALGSMSYFPEELLIRSLGQPGASQEYMIRTLETRTSLTQSAVEVLLEVLQGNGGPKEIAVRALGKQSTLPESVLQALIDALQHENLDNVDVRRRAVEVLEKQSTLPESAIQALIGALQHENLDVRWRAVDALGEQSTLPEFALQALIDALQHEYEDVRRRVHAEGLVFDGNNAPYHHGYGGMASSSKAHTFLHSFRISSSSKAEESVVMKIEPNVGLGFETPLSKRLADITDKFMFIDGSIRLFQDEIASYHCE
ncbi:hypothetical protein BGZ80_010335 [Entomortierella chlamydospora]|uniref:HEAT repeat domain-containing protein n=1 Tax=Entomortierella chlamydospora TaxID=101097 RepID=A0A9P6MV11_9FUNG|nr:hypothetical protein BGZ80_010335 [Entomortierella chlamydospora]